MRTETLPPQLAALPRDRRGLPCPWINIRGNGEDPTRWGMRHDRLARRPGIFFRDDPAGEVDFTKQSPQRQREATMRGLCQVDGAPIVGPRYLVLADVSVSTVVLPDGRRTVTVTEPWLCRSCADFAIRYCPALIRRKRTEHLSLVTVTDPAADTRIILSTGWIDGPYEAASKAAQPVMWAKISLDLAQPGRRDAVGAATYGVHTPGVVNPLA